MNIAFSALLILFLALPGIIACFAYRSERGRPVGSGPITDEVPVGLVVSVLLHTAWVILFNLIGAHVDEPVKVDLNSAVVLLAAQSGKDGELFQRAAGALTDSRYPAFIFLYFVSLCMASGIIGRGVQWASRRQKWDRQFHFLKWNDWFYLLQGESPDGSVPYDEYQAVRVTAVVGDYIYWGILVDYFVSRSGVLDSIVLAIPKRRMIGNKEDEHDAVSEPTAHPGAYPINAHYLVLKYSECKNIAVLGIKLESLGTSAPLQ